MLDNFAILQHYSDFKKIDEEYPKEHKWVAVSECGEKVLIQISNVNLYENKKLQFEIMNKLFMTGIRMQKPIACELSEDGQNFAAVYSWLDGKNLCKEILQLPLSEQESLGKEAGRIQRKIHSFEVKMQGNEDDKIKKKIVSKVRRYKECGIYSESAEKMVVWIETNLNRLHVKNQCILHGDFHIGNMILCPDGHIGILGFEQWNIGGPIEDLKSIVWCAKACKAFARGRILGYIEEAVPDDFYFALKLYCFAAAVYSIPCAQTVSSQETETALENCDEVLSWYSMESDIPDWINERPYYEAYDERYKQVHKQNLLWGETAFTEQIAISMEKYGIDKDCSILEIGCGEGRDTLELLKRGYQVTAIDCSPEAIRTCRRLAGDQYKASFKVVDFIKDSLDEKFDFIFSVCVLHMLVLDEHRRAFYQFLSDHLKYEGKALVIIQGNGIQNYSSDVEKAFDRVIRFHQGAQKEMILTATSYRAVDFDYWNTELNENHFHVVEQGFCDDVPGFAQCMIAVVEKRRKHVELFDAVDSEGNLLNLDMERGMPHAEGLYHRVVEVVTMSDKKHILVTRRHPEKHYGLKWECTGGSVLKGESLEDAALRELKEETGIYARKESLEYIGKECSGDSLYYIYRLYVVESNCAIQLQDGETIDYKWIGKNRFMTMLDHDEFSPAQTLRLKNIADRLFEE